MVTQFLKALIQTLVILALLNLIAACSDGEADDVSITLPSEPDTDPDTDTPTTPDPVEDTPVGEVEATGFWMNVVHNDQFDVIVSEATTFGTDCFIDAETTGNEFITCYVDVLEGQLYLHEIEMQYNAPPGMCDIVRVSPAWHWNQDIGYGPTDITLTVDTSGADPQLISCTAEHEISGTIACNTHPELTDVTNASGPSCLYDRTGEDLNNCCMGSYTLTKLNDTDGDLTPDETVITEDIEWGGAFNTCLSPYISTGWEDFYSNGKPSPYLQAVPRDPTTDTPTGLNDSVKLKANGEETTVVLSTWANFYTTVGTPHNHSGFHSLTTSNLPYMVDPIDDLSGTSLQSDKGNDAWIFECNDSALEVKHRITTYIREWNTLADYIAYETSGGVTYDPDVTGTEGTGCAYDPLSGFNCNDRTDIDDILTNAGGTYNTAPGVDDDARETYFPMINY